MADLESIKRLLEKTRHEVKRRDDEWQRGELRTDIKVIDLDLEDFIAKSGSKFKRLVVSYRNLANNSLQTKKVPLFTEEAKLIIEKVGMEPGHTYSTLSKKVDGYWRWQEIKEVSNGVKR